MIKLLATVIGAVAIGVFTIALLRIEKNERD